MIEPYYENESLTIYNGDSAKVLWELPEKSIQLAVTSPPYDNLRTYEGNAAFDFETIARGLYRMLCDGGVLCWNVNDSVVNGSETLTSCKQKIFFAEQCGFRVHDTMIYEKSNFAHPERARYHQLFEYVFVLSKGTPRAFNPIKNKRNLCAGTGPLGRNTMRQANGDMGERETNIISEFGMRGNVWRGNTAGQEMVCEEQIHPAPMPKWLARDLILSWSNPGDTILDPFGGGGTTSEQALEYGRKSIAIEISSNYCALIRNRCEKVAPLLLTA